MNANLRRSVGLAQGKYQHLHFAAPKGGGKGAAAAAATHTMQNVQG